MVYKCVRCGKITQNPTGMFSRIPSEDRFKGNDGFNDLCGQCSDLMFRTYVARYKDYDLRRQRPVLCRESLQYAA